MNVRFILPAIWTLSGALLLKLLVSWERLPERVAVHFDIEMQPNGWGSKHALAAMMLLVVLGEASLASWLILHLGNAFRLPGAVLLLVNAVLVSVFWQTIDYNAQGIPLRKFRILWPVLLMLAGIAFFIAVQRF